ncbi:CCA tRNA nucleotidyltransferase, mitochondrial [Clydaea vesicula]|uniref:CCA tRNA nucleotidyltransferase, mitochondrial n=1 Tax=Clydaea vesicula TaxID=447962 RepID=A0AAD5U497_9FUNG|nr:CCA tRNA nucleotidyltransferase, mitochondrial [Clydaea vesicula]
MSKIILTQSESIIRKILVECANEINKSSETKVTLRLAGGWVRDKLLNLPSDDIDVAVDTMSGYNFATILNNFCHIKGYHSHKVAKIDFNPEKSKHLETATMKMEHYQLDFVNLRTEVYENISSRVPVIKFGSPLEDAERRDITINALFYNLHTEVVEDFTNKGINDLQKGLIRTPLNPMQTFLDDPLRVLRVIRFASRLGYSIDSDVCEAAKSEEIKVSFQNKISRERVGQELEKMLKGPDPLRYLWILLDFGFYDSVFVPPTPLDKLDYSKAVKATYAVHWLLHSKWKLKLFPSYQTEKEINKKLLFLSAAMQPFEDLTYFDHKQKETSVAKFIILNSIKLSMHEAEVTSKILMEFKHVQKFIAKFRTDPASITKKSLGLFLRRLGESPIKKDYGMLLFFACATELMNVLKIDVPLHLVSSKNIDVTQQGCGIFEDETPEMTEILITYVNFLSLINSYGLEIAYKWKPILDGREVAKTLNLKPGKHIGIILEKVIEFQLDYQGVLFNSDGTYTSSCKEECVKYLQNSNVNQTFSPIQFIHYSQAFESDFKISILTEVLNNKFLPAVNMNLFNFLLLIRIIVGQKYSLSILKGCLIDIDTIFKGCESFQKAIDYNFDPYEKAYQPIVFTFPSNAKEVSKVISCAKAFNLSITARSGGHSLENSLSSDVIIDLVKFNQLEVNNNTKTINVGSGQKLKNVNWVLKKFNLLFAGNKVILKIFNSSIGGSSSNAGIGGYLLGGGFGYSPRFFAFVSDNIIEMQVVTADGIIRTVNQFTDPDLFWVLRGCGAGNFGIVTIFTVKIYPETGHVFSKYHFPLSNVSTILKLFSKHSVLLPKNIHTTLNFEFEKNKITTLFIGINRVGNLKGYIADTAILHFLKKFPKFKKKKFEYYHTQRDFIYADRFDNISSKNAVESTILEKVMGLLVDDTLSDDAISIILGEPLKNETCFIHRSKNLLSLEVKLSVNKSTLSEKEVIDRFIALERWHSKLYPLISSEIYNNYVWNAGDH